VYDAGMLIKEVLMSHLRFPIFVAAGLVLSLALAGCVDKKAQAELAAMKAQQVAEQALKAAEEANLANFDDLDFNVFSGQKWDQLSKSHDANIVVHWPDGHTTTGIEPHIADLKAMFVYAPDTHISAHPIKIVSGDYTAVTGVFEGTFTQPMPIGNGKTIKPTGKAFKLEMCTVGHWKGGVMDEEYLFWDNQTFMKQIGLAQ
jgi:SnoaL-like polyketide cyclase